MRAIWKYGIQAGSAEVEFDLPPKAKFVHFAVNPDAVGAVGVESVSAAVWFEVDPNTIERERRTLVIIPTGMAYSELQWQHLGTTVMAPFAWHLLEVFRVSP